MAQQTKLRVAGEKATTFVRAIGFDSALCLATTCKKGTCKACVDICPGHALRQPTTSKMPGGQEVVISKGFCVDCGLCAAVCPTSAMVVQEPTLRTLRRRLRRALATAGEDKHVYLTCVETGLADKDPSVVQVACLGMLSWEMWANLMLDFPRLAVFLPDDLCSRCKAKKAEDMIIDAVCHAQDVVGHDLRLVEGMRELDFTDSRGNVDPRRAEEAGGGFADMVHDITSTPEDELPSEEMGTTDSRKMRVRLHKELTSAEGENTPGVVGAEDLTGTITPQRFAILDAVMRYPEIAPRAELSGVAVDASACDGECAGACVDACPLGALTRDEATGEVRVEPLVCTACGLCVQVCESHAFSPKTTICADLLANK